MLLQFRVLEKYDAPKVGSSKSTSSISRIKGNGNWEKRKIITKGTKEYFEGNIKPQSTLRIQRKKFNHSLRKTG